MLLVFSCTFYTSRLGIDVITNDLLNKCDTLEAVDENVGHINLPGIFVNAARVTFLFLSNLGMPVILKLVLPDSQIILYYLA